MSKLYEKILENVLSAYRKEDTVSNVSDAIKDICINEQIKGLRRLFYGCSDEREREKIFVQINKLKLRLKK